MIWPLKGAGELLRPANSVGRPHGSGMAVLDTMDWMKLGRFKRLLCAYACEDRQQGSNPHPLLSVPIVAAEDMLMLVSPALKYVKVAVARQYGICSGSTLGNEKLYEFTSHNAASYQLPAVPRNPPCSGHEQFEVDPGWPKDVPKPERAGESYTQIPSVGGRDLALETLPVLVEDWGTSTPISYRL